MEMIESVARAICLSEGNDPDFNYDPRGIAGSDNISIRWRLFMPQARAAIEAMIIPTNGMLGEAAKAMSPGKRPTPDYVSTKQKHKIRYQAMIRKALEE